MSLLNFPNSPTTGDTYAFGVNIWEWTGSSWIKSGAIATTAEETVPDWIRPSDWLPLPSMTEGDQKFAGLYAIFQGASGNTGTTADSNFVALNAFGNYIIDWGDGITQAFTSGTTAYYRYNYENIAATAYSTQGYKQILIQGYPQSGSTLTGLFFNVNHPLTEFSTGSQQFNGHMWLDIKVCAPYLTQLCLTKPFNQSLALQTTATDSTTAPLLKQFEFVGTSGITIASKLFRDCFSLESVKGVCWTANINDMGQMFSQCYSLRKLPDLEMSSVLSLDNTFFLAYSLEQPPKINAPNCTNFNSLFGSCRALKKAPLIVSTSGITLNFMFGNCFSLKSFTNIPDITNAKSIQGMFQGMYSLVEGISFDTSNVLDMGSLYSECSMLKSVPEYNLSSATSTSAMFGNCFSLESCPDFNTPNLTNFTYMFNGCRSLRRAPKLNTNKCTQWLVFGQGPFVFCGALQEIPEYNVSAIPNSQSIGFGQSTPQLKRAIFKDAICNVTIAACDFSPTAINEMFTGLGLTGSGRTVTISGNWGTTGCNRSIATAKGWAVSG
jgi:hypothetical protein